ncbi:MAG: methyltransferase domain-containing protein [Bryobacteraceae bacterium]
MTTTEFTGERVIPGQVNPDLWNEHFSRYLFVSRLCRRKSVLDAGCGSGYGAAELARGAAFVTGIDSSADALAFAREHYRARNMHFVRGAVEAAPFRDAAFDLVVAFEVIEHLAAWPDFLREARRLLSPHGQFVVSTPNKAYYQDSRGVSGPNPFHEHEFTFGEFSAALGEVFPQVTLFAQNHAAAVAFQPVAGASGFDYRFERQEVNPAESHFFLAFCATTPQTGAPTFLFLPSAANVLREREQHVATLDNELALKNEWLERSQREHQELVAQHRAQTAELEARNRWAEQLNRELEAACDRVARLQEELAAGQEAGGETAAGYEAKIAELEAETRARAEWARETEERLGREILEKSQELARCVELLDKAEQAVVERTEWAQQEQRARSSVEARLAMMEASRWLRMGRAIGLGPPPAAKS